MKVRDFLEIGGNAIMYALSFTQTKEIFEIISLVLSIAISVLIIVSKIISWYKKAKEDGKITSDEINEGIDIMTDGLESLNDKLKDKEEKKDDIQGKN